MGAVKIPLLLVMCDKHLDSLCCCTKPAFRHEPIKCCATYSLWHVNLLNFILEMEF